MWDRITACGGYELEMLYLSQQCTRAVYRSVATKQNKVIIPVYLALNRPHVNHCIQFCSPPSHWKAAKMVCGHMTCEERTRDPQLHGDAPLKVPCGSLPVLQ